MIDTNPSELDVILDTAVSAWSELERIPLITRAAGLLAIAEALEREGGALIATAHAETGLEPNRLRAELSRTATQLRLFADVVSNGAFLDVRIDRPDTGFILGARPDLRRMKRSLGPVLNFAASNFPFAFSICGGDSVAAIAAGAPVVVKAHPGHPRLSAAVAEIATAALRAAQLPAGVLQVIYGVEIGVRALEDPRIAAASFTGSTGAGLYLAGVAAARAIPIPFFGELGSLNPVYVTEAAARARPDSIADAFVASVSGSAGQLCTKPGLLLVRDTESVKARIIEAAERVAEHRLLNASIARTFSQRRDAVLAVPGVEVLTPGSVRDANGDRWVTPTIVRTTLDVARRHRDVLLEEVFGPLAVVVEYEDVDQLGDVAADLFPGTLTSTIHLEESHDREIGRALIDVLVRTSGRVIVNGWPTGVSVTPAMEHGGPFPATTRGGTSVGTSAIDRFLRAVAYQEVPAGLLPPPLRDDNPWNVPQSVAGAGESARWGDGARSAARTWS